jgi:tetratricopeptide (TPR) repeat protein
MSDKRALIKEIFCKAGNSTLTALIAALGTTDLPAVTGCVFVGSFLFQSLQHLMQKKKEGAQVELPDLMSHTDALREALHELGEQYETQFQDISQGLLYICRALENLDERVIVLEGIALNQKGQITSLIDALKKVGAPSRIIKAISCVDVKWVHNIPHVSLGSLFKGRAELMEKLHHHLSEKGPAALTQAQAVSGLGGVGKTRLAVEYAWESLLEGRFTAVFFIRADTPEVFNTHLAQLAAPNLLNLPQWNESAQDTIFNAVLEALKRRSDWLLVIDNVDTRDAVVELCNYLPRLAHGHVLLTSRLSTWPDGVANLCVDKLDDDSASAYLMEKTEGKRALSTDDVTLAHQLSRALDGLPIALEQAGAYISQRRIGFADYLADFHKSRKSILSWHRQDLMNYPVPVMAAWETTEHRLSMGASSILRLAAFLSPEPIPTSLFESQPQKITIAAQMLAKDNSKAFSNSSMEEMNDIRGFLAELNDWSMIKLSGEFFTEHRILQETTRLRIPKKQLHDWTTLALQLVNDYLPSQYPSNDVRSWGIWMEIESHVSAISTHGNKMNINEPTTRLMNELGLYLCSRARYKEAEPLMRRALAIDEASFGPEHTKVAINLNNLATLLKVTNRLKEAEPLMRRALAIDEASFGPEHPDVAIRLNNLAQLLKATNRLKEAEPLMRRALAIDEASYGPEHPDVAIDLNNLATLLQATNRLKEAEPLMRCALAIDEASFGPEHPEVAIRLNNLAMLLKDTNRLQEAEPLMRRALDIDEASYGAEHPSVARDLNNLALLLKDTNRLQEAEPLMRRALAIDEASYGSEHPDVARDLNNLALLLQDTNRLNEAEPLMRRALAIDEASYGAEHPSVARDLNNLATLLMDTNRLNEAEPLMRRALTIFEKSLGNKHPNTMTIRKNLQILQIKITNIE